MAVATTAIDLCSQALNLIGQAPIDSFEGSDPAESAGRIYDTTVTSILSEHDWKIARGKRELSRLSEVPINQWKYYYQLPSEFLQGPLKLFTSSAVGDFSSIEFERFGAKVASNDERVFIDLSITPNVADMPPYLKQFIVYDLAWRFAPINTDSLSSMQAWKAVARGTPEEGMRGGYFAVARHADARNNPVQEAPLSPFIAVR
jgi:hypothetical protein